jgi:hypothetical protein
MLALRNAHQFDRKCVELKTLIRIGTHFKLMLEKHPCALARISTKENAEWYRKCIMALKNLIGIQQNGTDRYTTEEKCKLLLGELEIVTCLK